MKIDQAINICAKFLAYRSVEKLDSESTGSLDGGALLGRSDSCDPGKLDGCALTNLNSCDLGKVDGGTMGQSDSAALDSCSPYNQADVLMVFGNDLPAVAEAACGAFQKGIAKRIMFCGGVGHSTEILRKKLASRGSLQMFGNDFGAAQNDSVNFDAEKNKSARMCADINWEKCGSEARTYADINWEKCGSEAEMYAAVAEKIFGIARECILTENRSTNSGENAANALEILRSRGIDHKSIVLMQDPLMQLRSFLTLKNKVAPDTTLISYAPFIPEVDENLSLINKEKDLWSFERLVSLLAGEIRRVRDDEHGYGPNGAGFIAHTDIPDEVEAAYKIVSENFEQYCTR